MNIPNTLGKDNGTTGIFCVDVVRNFASPIVRIVVHAMSLQDCGQTLRTFGHKDLFNFQVIQIV